MLQEKEIELFNALKSLIEKKGTSQDRKEECETIKKLIKFHKDEINPSVQDPDNGKTFAHYAADIGFQDIIEGVVFELKTDLSIEDDYFRLAGYYDWSKLLTSAEEKLRQGVIRIAVTGNTEYKPLGYDNNEILKRDGLGTSVVAVDYDKNGLILDVNFSYQRPNISKEIKQMYPRLNADQEKCHRRGLEWIKQSIKAKYIGKSYTNFTYYHDDPFIKNREEQLKRHCRFNAEGVIAREYLLRFNDPKNIFAGDKDHNNFAGKLVQLLKPYIEKGEENLPFPHKITIKDQVGQQKDFGESIKKGLEGFLADNLLSIEGNTLIIASWDILLGLYFSANYDESDVKLDPTKGNNRSQEVTKNSLVKAIADFKMDYKRYSIFDNPSNAEGASASSSQKRSRDEDSNNEQTLEPERKRQKK